MTRSSEKKLILKSGKSCLNNVYSVSKAPIKITAKKVKNTTKFLKLILNRSQIPNRVVHLLFM